MPSKRQVASDISYAYSAQTRGGRAMIRLMENATGRLGLIKRADGYEKAVAQGQNFWQVIVERYGLGLDVVQGSLDHIPQDGPLIVIANHPYGILDGLMLGHILSVARGDFRILAHKIFRKAEELDRIILPVDFSETKDAVMTNIETRKTAMSYLAGGGAIGIFPGGTVSTATKPFSRPMDPGWRTFTARLIAKSDAAVVPIYFDGHTSRLFQLASHMHNTLRMGLLIQEFRRRVNTPVRVSIGAPIDRAELNARAKDGRAMMDYLRQATYELSPTPYESYEYGFEFEERHRS
ncbi:lysophospholipid acyltransferase family protein [Marinovum sp. 2_MG-2023]|uniref:lysophospholipid acyltransferase family protein n=1 Tax=unclassified Marinovum TaxID=2647166 RepID=UPI0026E23995|nr:MULTISPECIES: lysophospholipid acyltransferase family protein [unclassified Marinovum]MDO6730344.1 lysophospholipid acyltransferase family protein [Marinovum sp. 2_MG-2023]MDO6778324.1 lysophospholipid acyltransferase family protein [Marinovum sp. 1_MG-2023]